MPQRRVPVEARLLNGSYRPSRHGPLPEDTGGTVNPPEKPGGLSRTESAIWDRLTARLVGVVRDRDGDILADLCRWWAELKRVQTVLKKTKPGAKGYNQLLVAAGICSDKMDKFASRFGLTPSDRAKLRAEMVGPVKAKVATRPRTKLDAAGGPA